MSELSSSEISALHDALDDEHQAWATYDQVIFDFGEAGVAAEVANAALYERLLAATRRPEILAVFEPTKKVALTACMRKLLLILNAIVRTGHPWDPSHAAP